VENIDYQVSQQDIVLDPAYPYGSRWFVWEMAFPRGRGVNVRVSYEQALDAWRGYAQPMYVLRTGALWDGPINEATITMSALNGGALLGGPEQFGGRDETGQVYTTPDAALVLGADQAVERSETFIRWHLRDFKPTQDVGTTYVTASRWGALRDAENVVATGSPSADDYLSAVRAALAMHDSRGPWPVSQAILNRVPPARTRDWAERAVALVPQSATAWELLGDIQSWYAYPARKHHNELECWPTAAADAYRHALAFGSSEASERLAQLYDARAFGGLMAWAGLASSPCPGMPEPDPRPEVIAAEHIEVANRVWASVVNQSGADHDITGLEQGIATLDQVYGGAWLNQVRDQVRADALTMRARDQYRRPRPIGLVTVRSARLDSRGRIEALVSEFWDDRVVNRRDGSVDRVLPSRVEQRYVLERTPACGCWLITESQLSRSE
jgi:hypothetical protein